jgi:hypothetical protein
MYKAHAHSDCCEAMYAYAFVCSLMYKAHAHSDCCEAMYAYAFVCSLMYKAHAHSDCCEAMHACVRECVWACIRHMLTVTAVTRCMRVSESVFGLV